MHLLDNSTPPSAEGLLLEILPEFGLSNPQEIHSWPYPEDHRRSINRLVAKFTCDGQCYLMKARTVEHRGTRALFETQRIHQVFHQRGVSVPALHPGLNGETLIPGPNPRDESSPHYEALRFLVGPEYFHVPAVYYEIQHFIFGHHPPADEHTAYQIGTVLAAFHSAGRQPPIRSLAPEEWEHVVPHIDTFLLNKSLYINDFITRGADRRRKMHDYVTGLKTISPEERRKIDDLFCRIGDHSRQGQLSWGIIHGNFCLNNIIARDEGFFIIDLDEVGLGPISHDIGEVLSDLERADHQNALIKGYMENGGNISDLDRTDILDGLVYQQIASAFGNDQQELDINRLFAEVGALF